MKFIHGKLIFIFLLSWFNCEPLLCVVMSFAFAGLKVKLDSFFVHRMWNGWAADDRKMWKLPCCWLNGLQFLQHVWLWCLPQLAAGCHGKFFVWEKKFRGFFSLLSFGWSFELLSFLGFYTNRTHPIYLWKLHQTPSSLYVSDKKLKFQHTTKEKSRMKCNWNKWRCK